MKGNAVEPPFTVEKVSASRQKFSTYPTELQCLLLFSECVWIQKIDTILLL